jgi:hypothetical protein
VTERLGTAEKDYVLAKGCFANTLLIVVGGPLLFFGIALMLWLGVVFWPILLLALGAIAVVVTNRARRAKVSRQVIGEIVAARESLPRDVPGDGRTWVVRTQSGEFAASGPQLIEEWARLGRVRPWDHVFDAGRGCWARKKLSE